MEALRDVSLPAVEKLVGKTTKSNYSRVHSRVNRSVTDCSICVDGYTASLGYVCSKCSDSTAGIVLAAFLALAALCVAVAVVSYVMSGEHGSRGKGLAGRVARFIPLQSVKIVIVAWQILTQVR